VYRAGHLGVSLLVYAPLGVALGLAGRTDLAVLGELVMLSLATVPDSDHRLPFVSHRGPTHTVGFAVLVGLGLGAVGGTVSGQPAVVTASELAVFGFAVGTLAIVAHLLGDLLTPMGITPFWPLWNRTYTLALTRADNTLAKTIPCSASACSSLPDSSSRSATDTVGQKVSHATVVKWAPGRDLSPGTGIRSSRTSVQQYEARVAPRQESPYRGRSRERCQSGSQT